MRTGLYLAADVSIRRATWLLDKVGDLFNGVKTHMLTDAAARERIKILRAHGARSLWKDIKGHDTPDTIAGRAKEFQGAGADIITVHASGGPRMMKDAVETGLDVYAVVFLTSLTEAQFARYYQPDAVENMIEDAVEAGVAGLICPPTKAAWMHEHLQRFSHQPVIVSPGTRFAKEASHDQQQVDTPGAAVRNGADYLVIGRMVTAASDPRKAMKRLVAEIEKAERR